MVVKQIKLAVEIYSHLPRYREIFLAFFKYGFGDVLKLVHLQKLLEIKVQHLPQEQGALHLKRPAERFRLALEELGPTFVKFGQILSSRRDLVNEELHNELRKLQDQVPPFPGEAARKIVAEDLKQPIEAVFKEFEETALAAASVAQVHRAVLKSGDVVAVKVRRPDIPQIIEVDLAILADLARFLEKHVEEIAVLNPVGIVREFARTLMNELDFTNEARNMDRFSKQFRSAHIIRVPYVHHEFTTERVLTMEFLAGQRVDQPDELRARHIDPIKLSERMSKLIYQQMFQHGFFHGDPHPGNMTILPGGVTCLYDYGMMGNLTTVFRQDIATMILGLAEKNQRMVMRSLVGMSEQGFADDPRKLETDVDAFARHHLNRPLKELRLGFVLNRLLDLLMDHKLRMKADFYLGIKALSQVEAIGQELNPDLNFVKFGEPYATEVLEKKYDALRILKNLHKSIAASLDLLRDLPTDLQDLYERIKHGRYAIPIEHKINPEGFEPLRNTLNHIANRLTNAILASSLLICSGLLILADVPPRWRGMSVLGAVGLGLGVTLTLRIFLSIRKRGGL